MSFASATQRCGMNFAALICSDNFVVETEHPFPGKLLYLFNIW
jgi:hypothetical protein